MEVTRKTRRLGVFGGTFNPIHSGHIYMALSFAGQLGLDRVLVVPTMIPPHKQALGLIGHGERYAMCQIACAPYPQLVPCDLELRRGGSSYTVDTLRALHRYYPGWELCLLVGSDMFFTLEKWVRSEEIFALATLCAAARSPGELQALARKKKELEALGARCEIAGFPELTVSSTQLREMLAEGEAPGNLLPPGVGEYIAEKGLYRRKFSLEQKDYLPELEKLLTPYRLNHSLCVAKAAEKLALGLGISEKKAYLAGLLHDICKDMPKEQQLQWARKSGIIWDRKLTCQPQLWHGFAAAAFLREKLGIDDADLQNAVCYHTTARAGMSPLEKAVYLGDYISEDRTYPDVDEVRRLAKQSVDEAIFYTLRYTLGRLAEKGEPVCTLTWEAYNELWSKLFPC